MATRAGTLVAKNAGTLDARGWYHVIIAGGGLGLDSSTGYIDYPVDPLAAVTVNDATRTLSQLLVGDLVQVNGYPAMKVKATR